MSSGGKSLEDEIKDVVSIIQSCVSSNQATLSISDLAKDYRELTGTEIPFKKFKHGTLPSFLESISYAVTLYNRGGVIYVKAVSNEKNAHIQKLVSGQKVSKSKGSLLKHTHVRQPAKSNWVPPAYRNTRYSSPMFGNSKNYKNQFFGSASYNPRPPLLPLPRCPNRHSFNKSSTHNPISFHSKTQLEKIRNIGNLNKSKPPIKNAGKSKPFQDPVDKKKYLLDESAKPHLQKLSAKEKLKMQLKKLGMNSDIVYQTEQFGTIVKFWVSKIQIDDETLSSYPAEKKIKQEAEEVVSQTALEYIEEKLLIESLAITKDNSLIIKRILKFLQEEEYITSGIWWESICKLYQSTYKERLLHDWINNAPADLLSKISIDKTVPDRWIIKLQAMLNPAEPLPLLKFPEDEEYWKVYVTYVKDYNEIWFRLDKYNDAYSNLANEIDIHFLDSAKCVCNPVKGGFYICHLDSEWFRAQVIDVTDSKINVFCIDNGDTELVDSTCLYEMKAEFRKLPAQSICSSLAGTEWCFDTDPMVVKKIQEMLLGTPLFVKVLSDDFTRGPLPCVFYDTSKSEDININEEFLKLIPDLESIPSFPPVGGICEGYITHVNEFGEIFFRIEGSTYKYFSDMLETAKKRAAQMVDEDVCINLERLYLARFSDDGEWHRAVARSRIPNNNGKVFSCRLFNTPSKQGMFWTSKTSTKLLEIFPKNEGPFCLRVVQSKCGSQPALVRLWRRDSKNRLISVNDTLDSETNIFSSKKGDSNNNLESEENLPDIQFSPLPKCNEFFDIIVTYAVSPFNFAVHSYGDSEKLKLLSVGLQSFYSEPSNCRSKLTIRPGGFYAVLHSDEVWYRAKVLSVTPDDEMVTGVFVDYGDSFFAAIGRVQPLWKRFRQLPCQAFKAKLAGVAPVDAHWTPEDHLRFSELTENQAFVSRIISVSAPPEGGLSQDTFPVLTVDLIDTSSPDVDIRIAKVLERENRARLVPLET